MTSIGHKRSKAALGALAGFAAGLVLAAGLVTAQDGPRRGPREGGEWGGEPRPGRFGEGGGAPGRMRAEMPGRFLKTQDGVLDTGTGLLHELKGGTTVRHVDLARSVYWETPLAQESPEKPAAPKSGDRPKQGGDEPPDDAK